MKVKVGMIVYSSDGDKGTVVAMSKEWCILKTEIGTEYAYPWQEVSLELEPEKITSSIKKKDL